MIGSRIPAGRDIQSRALKLIFPSQCLLCGALVQSDGGLCGRCWRDTPFILGLCCDLCGVPLMGEDPGFPVHCDDCRALDRPWRAGRSVMLYDRSARKLILGLKHGDRLDLAPHLAGWMAVRAAPLLVPGMVIVPVPAHWRRLLKRRYNQAAVLAQALGRRLDLPVIPDLLRREIATLPQDGMGPEGRFANVSGAFDISGRRAARIKGRSVLLVDDVMTSGATLHACTETCLSHGAEDVRVMTLARVMRDA